MKSAEHRAIPLDIGSREKDQGLGTGYKPQSTLPGDKLLPPKLYPLKIPEPSQTAWPAGNQVFKLMSLCMKFHTETIIAMETSQQGRERREWGGRDGGRGRMSPPIFVNLSF